jgi:transketolase
VAVRVVSLPCVERFERQDQNYRDAVLPPGVRARLAIELAQPDGWYRYVGLDGAVMGMRTFGESAPAEDLLRHFGFTVPRLVETAQAVLAQQTTELSL